MTEKEKIREIIDLAEGESPLPIQSLMDKEVEVKSKCCNADVKTGGIGDFAEKDRVATMYYVCKKCNKPCDVTYSEEQ